MKLLFHRTTGMRTIEGEPSNTEPWKGVKTREARFVERNVDYTTWRGIVLKITRRSRSNRSRPQLSRSI